MRLLLGSVLLILTCSIVVFCQTKNQPSASAAKPAVDADVPKTFDPLVPRHVAEKFVALEDVQAKSTGLSRLAVLIWKQDQEYARTLFEKALAATTPAGNDNDAQLSRFRRIVIQAIATRDPEWARRLTEAQPALDFKNRNATNLNTALGLIGENPGLAVEFAERALQDQLSPAFLHFLLTLRKSDRARADQTFLHVLDFLGKQQRADITAVHSIGVYLFTAPDLVDSEFFKITRVDNLLVPNITAQRPGIAPGLVLAYLRTASSMLLRAATDASQQPFIYALGRLLLPKARLAAPDLVPQIEAAMSAVSANVPANLTGDAAYKYIDSLPPTPAESLANAERKPTQLERDMAFLDIAASAWRRSDYTTARKAASLIENADASQALGPLIDFGEAAYLLKSAASIATPGAVEKAAYKLPPGLERSILLLATGQHVVKKGNHSLAEESIDAALKASTAVDDVRRACLSLIAAGQLAQLTSTRTPTATAGAIKDLNSFADANYASIDWSRAIEVGALRVTFSLDITGLSLSLDAALRAIFSSDLESGFARAQELRNESLRSRASVEFVAAYLDNLEKQPKPKPARKKVSDDK